MLRDYLDDGQLPVKQMLRVWPFEIVWSLPLTDAQIKAAIWATRIRQQQLRERREAQLKLAVVTLPPSSCPR